MSHTLVLERPRDRIRRAPAVHLPRPAAVLAAGHPAGGPHGQGDFGICDQKAGVT